MALGNALVDRARIYTRQPVAARRVEGSTRYVDSVGPWIKARLTIPMSPEQTSAAIPSSRRRVSQTPTVMLLRRDMTGVDVFVTPEMRLGILSKEQFGPGVEVLFEVTADPEPIRKKRRVIGFVLSVRRVIDHPEAPIAGVG